MDVYVDGIGVRGPGLYGWDETKHVLAGTAVHDRNQTTRYEEKFLPANERRRASPIVRLAIDAGFEALSHCAADASGIATVFATSGGDGSAVHDICSALATQQRDVSPTRFHNSVHNAPAGYWNIAADSQQPSTTVCGYDASFAIGLLEAATLVVTRQMDVLLVACDMPFPFPLANVRPMRSSFAVGFVLRPKYSADTIAALSLTITAQPADESKLENNTELELLRRSVPSARALPLLQTIAKRRRDLLHFELYQSTAVATQIEYA